MLLDLLQKQGVPEKYVRLVKDTYEDARTQGKTSIGLTGKITVRVGLHLELVEMLKAQLRSIALWQ